MIFCNKKSAFATLLLVTKHIGLRVFISVLLCVFWQNKRTIYEEKCLCQECMNHSDIPINVLFTYFMIWHVINSIINLASYKASGRNYQRQGNLFLIVYISLTFRCWFCLAYKIVWSNMKPLWKYFCDVSLYLPVSVWEGESKTLKHNKLVHTSGSTRVVITSAAISANLCVFCQW